MYSPEVGGMMYFQEVSKIGPTSSKRSKKNWSSLIYYGVPCSVSVSIMLHSLPCMPLIICRSNWDGPLHIRPSEKNLSQIQGLCCCSGKGFWYQFEVSWNPGE